MLLVTDSLTYTSNNFIKKENKQHFLYLMQ